MSTDNKTAQLITLLIRETSKDNIRWEVSDAPQYLAKDTEQSVPLYLQTVYKGKLIGVYEIRSKYFYDEHEYYWTENIGLCIVDDNGKVIWDTQKQSPALKDLYYTARKQASGIDDILEDLLED